MPYFARSPLAIHFSTRIVIGKFFATAPVARAKPCVFAISGIAPIAMKSLGGTGKIVSESIVSIEEALRYVFSLPISTLVSGIDSEKVLGQNLKIVRDYSPMSDDERHALEARYHKLAGDGRFELFKSTTNFDGPVHRKQHGFEVA